LSLKRSAAVLLLPAKPSRKLALPEELPCLTPSLKQIIFVAIIAFRDVAKARELTDEGKLIFN
jgi:hypothetical protein